MDKIYELSLLLDFYGQLLTERQQEILDLHFNSDYSLGEIAEQLNISRQGVFDNIKRAKKSLVEFEEKLKLVSKFSTQKNKAEEALKLLRTIEYKNISAEDSNTLKIIEKDISDIISEIQ
ncbi:MAG: putative DNA-binding protein [Clostridia bacterium]|jgi:hypothetical protein